MREKWVRYTPARYLRAPGCQSGEKSSSLHEEGICCPRQVRSGDLCNCRERKVCGTRDAVFHPARKDNNMLYWTEAGEVPEFVQRRPPARAAGKMLAHRWKNPSVLRHRPRLTGGSGWPIMILNNDMWLFNSETKTKLVSTNRRGH